MKPSQPIVPSRATASRTTLRRMTLLLLAGALSASCGGDERSILVRVNGIPAGTPSLRATSVLGGKTDVGMDLTPPFDSFGLKLPTSNSGTLTLNVSAQDADKCKSASGTLDIELGSKNYQEVTITLNAISPVQCSVLFNPDGDGTATFTPAGKSCGPGCLDFDKGSMVKLAVAAGPNTYGGAAYNTSGNVACDLSRSSCTLTMTSRADLSIAYHNRICSGANWCWYGPGPQSNAILSVWGTSPSEVWAVGRNGVAMHFDGQSWTAPNKFPTDKSLRGVWGNAANNYWAVGEGGTILHYDGTSWQPQTSGTLNKLYSVWGSGSTDIWAVGEVGTVLHYDGAAWTLTGAPTSGTLARVFGSSPDNVWIVGSTATPTSVVLKKMSGTTFTSVTVPGASSVNLYDVWTSGPTDVWVAGAYNTANLNKTVFHLDASGSWTGSTPMDALGPSTVYALSGSSATDVWAATEYDGLYLLGQAIVKQEATGKLTSDNYSIWSSGPGAVIFGTADGNLFHRGLNRNNAYAAAPAATVAVPNVIAISGSGPTDVTVARKDPSRPLSHFDGKVWSVAPPPPQETNINDVWVASNGDVWTAWDGGRIYRNGVKMGNSLSSLYSAVVLGGAAKDDVWAANDNAQIVRYNGVSFSNISNPMLNPIRGIYARNNNEAWFVGDKVQLYQWTPGLGFTSKAVSTVSSSVNYLAISGVPGTGDIWLVGTSGTAARWNGSAWIKVDALTTRNLTSVTAIANDNVWLVGDGGTVRHWNGTSMETPNIGVNDPLPSTNFSDLKRIWAASATDIWATGISGLLVRYQPGK